jgi:aryl carrier-like protein
MDTTRNENLIKLALDTVDLMILCGRPLACGIALWANSISPALEKSQP